MCHNWQVCVTTCMSLMKVERDVSVATPKVSADETSMLSKLVALAQWVALLAIPQLFWRPAWASWISVIGGERNANVYGNCALTVATLPAGIVQLPCSAEQRVPPGALGT